MAVLSSPLVLIQSIPPVTRAFTAATVIQSALYGYLWWRGFGADASYYMTIIPGSAIYTPWTLFTSAFVETSVFEFIGSLIFVPASLKYLERLWGAVETAKFIFVSIVASNIITLAVNWIEYFGTRNADLFLFGMRYHGQMALQIAIMVAFTQLIPEHQVQLFGVINTRVKTLPMAYLTLSTVLCLFGFQCPWIVIQFGWFVGWVYLRFYKKQQSDSLGGHSTYGDRSETFSLVSWFPPFMHPPLTILGNFVHSLATRLHLLPGSSSSDTDEESGAYAPLPANGSYSQLPGTARAEAERRRAIALKALDQRMANNSPAGSKPKSKGTTPATAATSSDTATSNGSPIPSTNVTLDDAKALPDTR